MTGIGDDWRAFAYEASRLVKNRSNNGSDWQSVSASLHRIADKEQLLFEELYLLAKEWDKKV